MKMKNKKIFLKKLKGKVGKISIPIQHLFIKFCSSSKYAKTQQNIFPLNM